MTKNDRSPMLEEKILVQEKTIINENRDEAPNYSIEICNKLEQIISQADLIKKYHPNRYDKGKKLHLDITGVYPAISTTATFEIEKFIGGGFAQLTSIVALVLVAVREFKEARAAKEALCDAHIYKHLELGTLLYCDEAQATHTDYKYLGTAKV